MLIESKQNPTVKRLVQLQEAKGRKEQGRFLIDTPRDQARALEAKVEIVAGYFCKGFPIEAALLQKMETKKIPLIEMSRAAFEAICYRENPSGLVLEAKSWPVGLAELKIKSPTLVILAEDIEKPGNLGTLLRTADAVGADAVVGANDTVELFNPNTLRASAGAAFAVPYAAGTLAEIVAWAQAKKLKLVATSPAAKKTLWQANLKVPLMLAVGSEAWGLSEELLNAADEVVALPMRGTGDSLNVSVASGAIAYEILRQRQDTGA